MRKLKGIIKPMPASGPGSCASPPPEGFCAWKITRTNKKHFSQVPGERMLEFLTPRWWSSPKTHSNRDPAVFRRSLRKFMEAALPVIFIWVALISPHSPVCGDAMRLCHILQEWAPSCQTVGGRQQERGQVCPGTAGLAPWPKSNTQPRWTCSHYKRKQQSLQVRLQGKAAGTFSFSLFCLFSVVQKFWVVVSVKSLSFSSCRCKCDFCSLTIILPRKSQADEFGKRGFFCFPNFYPTEQIKPLDVPAGLCFNWIKKQVLIPLFELHHT